MLKAALTVALACALGAGGAYLFMDWNGTPTDGASEHGSAEGRLPAMAPSDAISPPAPPAASESQQIAKAKNPLATGMTSANPLAFVTEMRQKGGPGAYAMADQVTYQCREALQALRAYGDPERATLRAAQLARNVGLEGVALSTQSMAAQKIEGRCRPFADDLESDTPKADDASAKAYQDALQALLAGKDLKNSLKELATQGQLQSALVGLRGRYRLKGEDASTPEDRDLLARAMTVAAFNASTDTQSQADDLRVLTSCLYSSICDGSFESEYLGKWPVGSPQRQRAETWIAQFQEAFASNNYAAFLPTSKGSGRK